MSTVSAYTRLRSQAARQVPCAAWRGLQARGLGALEPGGLRWPVPTLILTVAGTQTPLISSRAVVHHSPRLTHLFIHLPLLTGKTLELLSTKTYIFLKCPKKLYPARSVCSVFPFVANSILVLSE